MAETVMLLSSAGQSQQRLFVRASASSSLGHAAQQFKMSDFDLYPHVSIGLAGRSDEVLFEGIVNNPNSNLKGKHVVLRQLTGTRAQRRGKRALEAIPKLLLKEDIYHSYATRVHGFVQSPEDDSLTLVHGYYGSYSLHHWFLCVDWLPNLEERLALDEGSARRVGDITTGGPEVTRHLRLTRMLMRDILIGVNYLHRQGLAHTQLRLNNLHVSSVDRRVKVGILGNSVAFCDIDQSKDDISKRMIAYDIRCLGYVMAKMVIRELMDPDIFALFKQFFAKKLDPAGLREFLRPLISAKSPNGSTGLQVLDRNGGAGWHLLACMLANDADSRISSADALRHPFLCGPKWNVNFTLDMVRWNLGSAATKIIEEYIYMNHQRSRLSQLIDSLERINPMTRQEDWRILLPGKWRLLYHTGRQIGLTMRQASQTVLIGDVMQTFNVLEDDRSMSMSVEVGFTVMPSQRWSHDKSGYKGSLTMSSSRVSMREGQRKYQDAEQAPFLRRIGFRHRNKGVLPKDAPDTLPVLRLDVEDLEVSMELDGELSRSVEVAQELVQELRIQLPREMFFLSRIVCATYADARLLVLRSVSGAALLLVRSCMRYEDGRQN